MLFLAMAVACSAVPALAQDARPADAATPARPADVRPAGAGPGGRAADPHQDATDLDTVIVRATPRAQTADSLARPVEVLSGEALDAAKASSIGETVARLPGVQSSYFGPGVGRPVIRGLDGARVQVLSDGLSAGDVSTVSVDHAVSIEPFLANQVEVLKGPATLLYGSGAIGGAVNVVDGRIPESITVQPFEGRAELRAGSVNDEKTGMLRLDGTSASGRVVFHADALHRETGDYRIPGDAERAHAGEEQDGDHDEGVRGRLGNSALRTDSGALGMSWIGDRGFLGIGASLYDTRYGVPGHAHAGHDDHGHDEEEEGEEGPVTIGMDQRRTELRGGLDALGPFETLRVKVAHTDYTHTEYEGDEVGTVFDNDSTEARLELTHGAWAGWAGAFGLQWSKRDFVAVGEEAFVPASLSRDTGLFWIGERAFGPVRVELGARHDRNRVEVDPQQAPGGSRDFNASSLSAALRWDIGSDLHLSLGLDRAQRTPTAEELYSDGLHVATSSYEFGDARLDRETANRLEAGLHWHADGLRASASIYHVRYADFIYLADTGVIDGGLPARAWTQADARFTGAEGDVTWTFLDNDTGAWDLRVFGDVVRGKLAGNGSREVSFSVPHGDHSHDYTVDVALAGNLPRIAPARLGGELLWNRGGLRASLGAVRYAAQDDVAVGEEDSPGYTLVDAHLAWHTDTRAGGALEFFLDGSNLLDREARPHTSFLKDLAPLPGRGVSAGVRLFF